jgi:hypothetical protein
MTDEQKIAYLAERMMGWCVSKDGKRVMRDLDDMWNDKPFDWNPLADWNHWRQVEEKVMEDEKLIHRYWDEVMRANILTPIPRLVFIFADLPTRVSALIAAHQSLRP